MQYEGTVHGICTPLHKDHANSHLSLGIFIRIILGHSTAGNSFLIIFLNLD